MRFTVDGGAAGASAQPRVCMHLTVCLPLQASWFRRAIPRARGGVASQYGEVRCRFFQESVRCPAYTAP